MQKQINKTSIIGYNTAPINMHKHNNRNKENGVVEVSFLEAGVGESVVKFLD